MANEDVSLEGIAEGKEKKPKYTDAQWWRCHEKYEDGGRAPHEILDPLVKQIWDDQASLYESYTEYSKLFGNTSDQHGAEREFAAIQSSILTQNELANTIETLWAQVFKNRVCPSVSVSESDYEEWSRAKAYSRWIEGTFDAAEVYDVAIPKAGLGALIDGTGGIRVDWEEDAEDPKVAHIKAYPIMAKNMMVDRIEARHGNPRSFFLKDHVDKWHLWEIYKEENEGFHGTVAERLKGILDCKDYDELELATGTNSNMISIREGWHLPSYPGAKDGRHVIWIRGCTLVDEPYEWDQFPIEFIKFGATREGFYGESAVKRIAPTQRLLDKLNAKIDESQDVMGVPRIIVQRNSGIVKAHIDDIPGGVLEADNIGAIREWNATTASPELYNDRDQAPRKMRSLLGVSDFEVQQQIPQGMRDVSGAFLERWVDQGQARHAMFHKAYERLVCRLALLFARMAEDLQKKGYKVVVRSPGETKSSIQMLDFEEVCIDRKKMKLQVLPMSQLPQTFAGKIEAIEKLRELMPELPAQTIARMTEVPDINGTNDMMVSDEEIIMKNLNFMVKKGKYLSPLGNDNLELIISLTTRFINCYRIKEDADGDKVAILMRYIDDAKALLKGLGSSDMAAPPPPMGPPGPPMGDPMAPSVPGGPPGPMPPEMGAPGGPMAGPGGGEMPPMSPPGMPM